ncbi:MAG: dienelactone hydrolase family protein [Acidimicrobiales bacterium]
MPDITIQCPDGAFSAYLAEPESGAGAGILVIQEIFGVNQDLRAHCDALAEQGYFAVSPDLYWRQEPGVQLSDQTDAEWNRAAELYLAFDVSKGIEDLQVTLTHLRGMDGCSDKVGTVGYCLGGLLAYLMATRSDADCNVGYYGVGIEGYLHEAGKITRPTMLHIGEQDRFVLAEAQQAIAERLADHPLVTLHSYPDVDHAFARNNGNHYDTAAAQTANLRSAAFFRSHL